MGYSHKNILKNAMVQRAGLAAALTLSTASSGVAGLIGPGGDAHIWSGAVNTSWHIGGNWTNGQVPASGDAAIINGGPANIFLNGDSAALASLFLSGNLALSNNGHFLNVTNGAAVATITGVDSRIFVTGAGLGFDVDTLDVESEAALQLSGGHTRVNTQLTLSSDARITGHGLIEVNSGNLVPFNGLGGELISASGGELMVTVAGGGAIALPPLVNVLSANSSLIVDGPMFLSVNEVNLGPNTEISFDDGWTLSGALDSAAGAGNMARITGGLFTVQGDIDVSDGELVIEAPVYFDFGSGVNVGSQDILTIAGAHDAASVQTTTVAVGGILRINGEQGGGPAWAGDIDLTASVLEVNGPQNGGWRMSGDLMMDDLVSFRARLIGSAPVRLTGDITLAGNGGEFETHVDLRSSSTVNLVHSSTELVVEDMLIQRAGSDIFGSGTIEIAATGSMLTTETADIDVDIVNAGEFGVESTGSDVGYIYIGGSYVQQSSGRIVVQIAGDAPTQRDVYETQEEASLAGELFVELLDDFEPMMGQTFEVFTANGGVNGMFESLTGAEGFEMSLVGNTVVLTYTGLNACPSDINGDGNVDGGDLASLLANWGTSNMSSDLNGDGIVNGADLASLLADWGACP